MTEKRFKVIQRPSEFKPFMVRRIYDECFNKEYDCTFKHQDDLCNLLNELDGTIRAQKHIIDKQEVELSKVESVLQKHHDYAYNQRQKNLDNVVVAKAYDVLRGTVWDIARELGVKLK